MVKDRDIVAKLKIIKSFSSCVCWWFTKIYAHKNFSEIHAEFSGRVATSIHEIVGDVVRDGNIVAKLKTIK